jgi:hypothetical protein
MNIDIQQYLDSFTDTRKSRSSGRENQASVFEGTRDQSVPARPRVICHQGPEETAGRTFSVGDERLGEIFMTTHNVRQFFA